MRPHITLREGEGGEGTSNGGGGDTLLSGGQSQQSQQNTQQPAQQATANPADEGAVSKFDFRAAIGEDGNFKPGWADSLPDALKPAKNELGKYANPTELFLGHWNKAQLLGQRQEIKPPAPDAKPEEIAKWRKTIGVPDSPEGYQFAKPENLPEGMQWSEEAAKNFAKVAHDLNLTPMQAAKLAEFDMAQKQSMLKTGEAKIAELRTQAQTQLKTEWGENYEKNLAKASQAATKLGADLKDSELANNPKFIKLMLSAGLLMQEDKLVNADGTGSSLSGEAAVEDIRRNQANPWHAAYMGKEGKERQQMAAAHMNRLRGITG